MKTAKFLLRYAIGLPIAFFLTCSISDTLAPKIRSETALRSAVEMERKKLNIADETRIYSFLYDLPPYFAGGCRKLKNNVYVILIDKKSGNYHTVRHELYHIAKNDAEFETDTGYGYVKYFFYQEPKADFYSDIMVLFE